MQHINEINIGKFNKYKNQFTFVLRDAEAKYYQKKFREYDSLRRTWKIINERINNVKTRNIPPYITTTEGVKITEKGSNNSSIC